MLRYQGDDADKTAAEHRNFVPSQDTSSTRSTTWTTIDPLHDKHKGYVSGQRANGTRTTVIGPLDHSRFVAYIPRCECGWTGPCFSPTPAGYAASQQLWQEQHLRLFVANPDPTACRASSAIGPTAALKRVQDAHDGHLIQRRSTENEDSESIAAQYLDDI